MNNVFKIRLRRGKIIVYLVVMLLAVVGLSYSTTVNKGESKVKPYYSGEAVSYQGNVYFGTVNTGAFELFTFRNGQIQKQNSIISTYYKNPRFGDLKFQKEDGRLYVYLVDGRYLYKYDITNPLVPELKTKLKDNAWDWFQGLEEINGHLATIGIKGVKIWNQDMQVVNEFDIHNQVPENISFSETGRFIFNIKDGQLKIFDTKSRTYRTSIDLDIKKENEIRKIFNDKSRNRIYVVDDQSLKAYNFAGDLKQEFKHTSSFGYDVISDQDEDYLYFSDGIGMVKIDKDTFEAVDWKYTNKIVSGSWLMRIHSLASDSGERIVDFNASNIAVMNKNLQILDYYPAQEKDMGPFEPLFLKVDKNQAAAGSQVALRGGGYGAEEKVKIHFVDQTYTAYTNKKGRFLKIIEVPSVLPVRADIRVVGQISDRDYSLGFEIQ